MDMTSSKSCSLYVPWSRLSRFVGDGHPTFYRKPYNGYINPYYWVDDHPLLYGNNGSLDPGTYIRKCIVLLYASNVDCIWQDHFAKPPA